MCGLMSQWNSAHMSNQHKLKKIKILGAILELPAKTALPIQPIFVVNGVNWQCSLAGSSKTVPRILIFSIAMGAKPLS